MGVEFSACLQFASGLIGLERSQQEIVEENFVSLELPNTIGLFAFRSFFATSGETGSQDRIYSQVWGARTWRSILSLEDSVSDSSEEAYLGRFSDDGKVLTTVNYNHIEKWKLRDGKRFKTIPLEFAATDEDGIEAKISTSGSLLLMATGFRIALMETSDGKVLQQFNRHTYNNSLTLSPDEKLVAETDFKNRLRVWETRTGKTLWELSPNDATTVFSDNSQRLKFLLGRKRP